MSIPSFLYCFSSVLLYVSSVKLFLLTITLDVVSIYNWSFVQDIQVEPSFETVHRYV